ncbi:MAG: hypothetical protein ACYCV7_06260 [Acidimicrobiales bacterium]
MDPRQGDHALGIELQLNELVEQRARARAQGNLAEVANLEGRISALWTELADASDPDDATGSTSR